MRPCRRRRVPARRKIAAPAPRPRDARRLALPRPEPGWHAPVAATRLRRVARPLRRTAASGMRPVFANPGCEPAPASAAVADARGKAAGRGAGAPRPKFTTAADSTMFRCHEAAAERAARIRARATGGGRSGMDPACLRPTRTSVSCPASEDVVIGEGGQPCFAAPAVSPGNRRAGGPAASGPPERHRDIGDRRGAQGAEGR